MKGYLFDLDGTLIQSMHVWEDAVLRLFERLHLTMDIDEARDVFSAMKFSEVLDAIVARFQLDLSSKQLYDMVIHDVRDQYEHHIPAVDGAVDYVKRCYQAGKEMCVVTANDTPLTNAVLGRLGMLDEMKFVLSSEESGLTKRTPQMALEAISRLHLEPKDCVMLEDSLYSMQSAKEAGCYVIAIATPKASDYKQICETADEVHPSLQNVPIL